MFTATLRDYYIFACWLWLIYLIATVPLSSMLMWLTRKNIRWYWEEISIFIFPFWIYANWFLLSNRFSNNLLLALNILIAFPLIYVIARGRMKNLHNSNRRFKGVCLMLVFIISIIIATVAITTMGGESVPLYNTY